MGGSLSIRGLISTLSFLAVFAVGVALGASEQLPTWLLEGRITSWVLYVLMVLVGIGVGADGQTLQAVRHMRPHLLLLPLLTVVGTALGALVAWSVLPSLMVKDAMAVGAGFGYYSLSSIIICEQHSPTVGALALLSNVFRELMALLLAPLIARWAGNYAPVCAAGATSMDTVLPFITAATHPANAVVSIYHGLVLSVLVPALVGFALMLP